MFYHCPLVIRAQRGIVLVTSLIFLLVLTLIGVTAMQGTTMQERMSGNMQDRNVAFQAAEVALRAGEGWLQENEYDTNITTARLSDSEARDWDGVNPEPRGSGQGSDQLHADPVYYIGESYFVLTPGPNEGCDFYPVTSRAAGRSESTIVVIRAYYKICH